MAEKVYNNPVIPGFYPDPSIVRVGPDYYLVTSSFEYFPGVPIFHSRDLVNWRQIGHVLTRHSQLNLTNRKSSQGIFAPTIRYHDGLFYMVTTDVYGIGNFYVTASDPAGPWSDPIRLEHGGIDPSLFFDDDGKVYVTAQRGADLDSHAIQYEIDPATGKALTEPVVVFRGDGGPWCEGPHLYKINGMYYLMAASGGTSRDHREVIARSDHPYGPFELLDRPILTHNRLPDHPIQALGHADLVDDENGNWWCVFLGMRPVRGKFSILGRETFLAPVNWTEDGWPMIDNNEGTVALRMSSDRLTADGLDLYSRHLEEFEGTELSPVWSYLRTDGSSQCSLTERSGWLALHGNEHTISEAAPALFVSRRQQHVNMEASTKMAFDPQQDGEEAGIAARLDDNAHVSISVIAEGGQRYVRCCRRDKGVSEEIYREPIGEGELELAIRCNEEQYELLYRAQGNDWVTAARTDNAPLSPERNWCFTGACLGMFATGNGKRNSVPAYFDYFHYESREG